MMSPDEKRPIAENEAPKEVEQVSEQDTPLTQEEFEAQMQRLTERAKAAGLNPIQTMLHSYASRGRAIINSLLGALENADSAKKKE